MSRTTIEKPRNRTPVKATSGGIRNYRSALKYLNSLINFEQISPERYASKRNLSRSSRLMSALGHPQKRFKSVHIAGTKGKGSTATMLAEMLRSTGYLVGLYTSPHIMDIRERIVIDGKWISTADFAKSVAAVEAVTKKARVTDPTYFEILTAAAFHRFAEAEVEVAVVETGLGGRLDCTNVITPEVVGITGISYDHMQQLGSTLSEIAAEKAGIMKRGIPVVTVPQRAEVKETLSRVAAEVEAPLRVSNEDVAFSSRFEFSRTSGKHTRICFTTPISRYEHVQVPLLGDHQAVNCGLVLNIVDTLKGRGFKIDDQLAAAGLANVHLPGRMEMICEEPRILVDGAHNAASLDALVRAIGQNITYDSMVVLFGCQRHKDIPGMMRRLQLGADKVVFTGARIPQSADPTDLAAHYLEQCGKVAQVADDLEDALTIARSAVSRGDLICITGSFYLVAAAKRLLAKSL